MQGQPSTDLSRLQERGWLGNRQTPKPKPWGMDAPQGRSPLCAYFHCWDRSGMLNMRHASYQVTDTSAPYHQNPQWEHWEGLHQEPQTTQEASIFPLEALPAARHSLKTGEELKCEENETLERLASPQTQGVDLHYSPFPALTLPKQGGVAAGPSPILLSQRGSRAAFQQVTASREKLYGNEEMLCLHQGTPENDFIHNKSPFVTVAIARG